MNFFKYLFSITIVLSFLTVNAQTKKIEDVDFNSYLEINGEKTVLNGGGIREKYGFMDLYVGALYINETSSDADKIIMADDNMGIRIVIVSGLVTRDRFIEALEEGFVNTTAGKSSPSDVDKFKKFLSDPFVEGDEIVLNYHKGESVHLYKNNQERGTFDGLEFKQALFGIWLGGNPADDDLKEGMLGL
ncbi:chalcone isomerase family protein [Flavobacteriales bacterium]|nr:chalcone isomerase family protein [Flavobacteriales bacterium]|tara:strand:+ start:1034 stop:1600 length:567 start_codon:yes stop_codon:yes gene_type:complete